jgi:succinoglycan biosynthesis protein ExoO
LSPRFSVIVPVHNKARHVAAAIESVLDLSRPPHEVIAIDDASTDGSAEILSRFHHPALKLLRRDLPGPGGYAARNLGIERATGDWIAFLDADDCWDPDHLADLAMAIERHPEAGCAATRYVHIFADRQALSRTSRRLEETVRRPARFEEFLRIWLELVECPIWTGAAAFRREVLIDAGLFPAGLGTRGGDKDLWLRAAARAPFVYVPRPSAEFHHESDNKVTKTTTTTATPMLVRSAHALMAAATPAEEQLLRALVNQQIGLYARFAFKSGRLSPGLLANTYLPEGWQTWLLVCGIGAVPAGLRRWIYGLLKQRFGRRLAGAP